MTTPTPPSSSSTPPSRDAREAIAEAMSRVPVRHPHRARVAAVTVLSVLVVLIAVVPYLRLDPSVAQGKIGLRPNVPLHFPFLVVHALTAGIALLLGPWQFVRRIRRIPRLHRYIGRGFLFAGVLPASAAGMVVAWLSTAGTEASLGFTMLDVAWVGTAVAGYRAARSRRYRDHERWMVRCFGLTFAGVTLRLWMPILVFAQQPLLDGHYHGDSQALFHTAYAFVPWLCWIPNLLAVEYYLSRRSHSTPRDASASALDVARLEGLHSRAR